MGKWDAVIVGGGHNGLVAAALLGKAGKRVLVLERRHVLGGAAVTEEIVKGFHFSRASYVLSLFQPKLMRDLQLHRHGLRVLPRDPSSFTPSRTQPGRGLTIWADEAKTAASIAQFSQADAAEYPRFAGKIERIAAAIEPTLDVAPPDLFRTVSCGGFGGDGTATTGVRASVEAWLRMVPMLKALAAPHAPAPEQLGTGFDFAQLSTNTMDAVDLLMTPASQILDRNFESPLLKATLATDAVIGAMNTPEESGSGYVLLHHMMGSCVDGRRGVWGYVQGGMGGISAALAAACDEMPNVTLRTGAPVRQILTSETGAGVRAAAAGAGLMGSRGGPAGEGIELPEYQVNGVELADGEVVEASVVLSNASPHVTLGRLLSGAAEAGRPPAAVDTPAGSSPPIDAFPSRTHFEGRGGDERVLRRLEAFKTTSAATKINIALKAAPSMPAFASDEDPSSGIGPHHHGTIHFEEDMSEIHRAFVEAQSGRIPERPVVEMTVPSALDKTISPDGQHVALLFVQYTPYSLCPEQVDEARQLLASGDPVVDQLRSIVEAHWQPGWLQQQEQNKGASGHAPNDRHPDHAANAAYRIDHADSAWDDVACRVVLLRNVLRVVADHCPDFLDRIEGIDMLSPVDLERVLGLPRGNIFHGNMSLNQLAFQRPAPGFDQYAVPSVSGLYMCGSGTHPGGGVMGRPGANAAERVMADER